MKYWWLVRGDTLLCFLVVCCGLSLSCERAFAQPTGQQQWASQYVNWTFDGRVEEVWNIDQEVWIPQPSNNSYWPMQWTFKGLSYGGYMGLQQQGSTSDQNGRFSIWNATLSRGPNCKPFGGEGVGQTCTLPVKIDTKKFYRLRLLRLASETDGQWWGGWLIEANSKGALTEHFIGQIKAPAGARTIDPNSIKNFVEYFGPAFATCESVPLSIIGFTPPTVNRSYLGYSKYGDSIKAPGNSCSTGKESNGAVISAKPYDFGFANGVMMFLGGTLAQHTLDKTTQPTPPGVEPIHLTGDKNIEIVYFNHAWSQGTPGAHNGFQFPHYEFFVDFKWWPGAVGQTTPRETGVSVGYSNTSFVNCATNFGGNIELTAVNPGSKNPFNPPNPNQQWPVRATAGQEYRMTCAVIPSIQSTDMSINFGDFATVGSKILMNFAQKSSTNVVAFPVSLSVGPVSPSLPSIYVKSFDYSWMQGDSYFVGHANGYDFPHYNFFVDFASTAWSSQAGADTGISVYVNPPNHVNCATSFGQMVPGPTNPFFPPDSNKKWPVQIMPGGQYRLECQVIKSLDTTTVQIAVGDFATTSSKIVLSFGKKTR